MGNYFRQIYTSIHREWRTTAVDPCRRRERGGGFFFSSLPGVNSEKAIGVQRKSEGTQAVAQKARVINRRSGSGSASIVGVMGQMSAALMALPDAWLWPLYLSRNCEMKL